MVQTVAAGATISEVITQLMSIFTTIFSSAFSIITENWYLFVCIGVPLVGGILFSIISYFKGR